MSSSAEQDKLAALAWLMGQPEAHPMARLVSCLTKQTETLTCLAAAIHALAASNHALVAAMIGPDDEADPDAPSHYLNGQPVGH